MSRKLSLIPNLDSAAEYDSFSHYCEFKHINHSEFQRIFSKDFFSPFLHQNNEVIKTIIHELTHFYDHIGTLHGQRLLIKQARAIQAWQNQSVDRFIHIKEYANIMHSLAFSEYYTQHLISHERKGKTEGIWGWNSSVGLRFNDSGEGNIEKPILFINFIDPETSKRISRVPFTTFSFWELNAISKELYFDKLHIDQYKFKESAFQESKLDFLYSQNNAIYTVGAHLYSNITGEKNIYLSYAGASLISTFLMNLPQHYISRLPDVVFKDPQAEERVQYFKKNSELSYYFYSLVHFIFEKSINILSDNGLNDLIRLLDFDTYNQLMKDASLEMISNSEEIGILDPSGYFKNLILNKGLNALKFRGLFSEGRIENLLEFPEHVMPTMIFRDTDILATDTVISDSLSILEDKFLEFHKICGA